MADNNVHGRSYESPLMPQVFRVIKKLVESEDNTGCTEDLTVVDKKHVDALQAFRVRWLAAR